MNTARTEAIARSVSVDTADVTYTDSRTTGTPVVLLHGFGGRSNTDFFHLFPMLAARNRVISLDFSSPVDGSRMSFDSLCRQVSTVLDACVPGEPVVLVGFSLGATVATAVAARHPNQVDKLVLLAGWLKATRHAKTRIDLWRLLGTVDPLARQHLFLYTQFSPVFLAARTEAEIESLIQSVDTTSEIFGKQLDLMDEIDLTDLATAVRAQTLVIGCSQDLVVPRAQSEALFGAIADSRLAFVDSGHAAPVERPAEVFSLIDAFATNRMTVPAGALIPTASI